MCAPEKGHPSCGPLEVCETDSGFELYEYARIDGVPRKLERLALAKENTLSFVNSVCKLRPGPEIAALGEDRSFDELLRLRDVGRCGALLRISRFPEVDDVQWEGFFCNRHLCCRACAIRRGSREMAKAIGRVGAAAGAGWSCPYMLTVTVQNGASLVERFEHLSSCFRRVLSARRKRGMEEIRLLSGGMYSFEFGRGKDGLWHPHIHAFVVAPSELPLKETQDVQGRIVWRWPGMEELWRRVTGDSFILECHPVRGYMPGDSSTLVRPFCEVFKYALKVNDLGFVDRANAAVALRGRRLLGSFGVFYGLDGVDRQSVSDARFVRRLGVKWDRLCYWYRGGEYLAMPGTHATGVFIGA